MRILKPTRAQIAQGFKVTKKYLAHREGDGKNQHICFAMSEAYRCDRLSYDVWQTCRNIIRVRLRGYVCYTDWVRDHGISRMEIIEDYNNGRVLCQAGRHAWVNDLIREFSK